MRICTLLLPLLLLSLSPFSRVALADEQTAQGGKGMVAAVSAPGADVGLQILKQGGNAVDAAVAMAFAMAVTYPPAGNIGGGGFMVVFPGGKAEPEVIEYRETAPLASHKTMFKRGDSWYSHKASGVPGTVRGLSLAHSRHGKLPWKQVVLPAVKLAREGFFLDAPLAKSLNGFLKGPNASKEMARVLGKKTRGEWQAGERLVQKDLADTLQRIADHGADGFYKGKVADLLVAEMKRGGGLITQEDLTRYRAHVRKPVHGTYRGHDIYAVCPPSSGGVCLVEMLNILEPMELRKKGRWSPETLHLMIEAMRRAYCDRARHLGDPDFVPIPGHLTTREYARKLASKIDPHKATPSEQLAPDIPLTSEGDSTTHFSVIDSSGMAVSNTYTLERSYGSGVMVSGAGFLLNNEMGDFGWLPGVTSRGGQIGTAPNLIAPGKRMLSSQTPVIVARNGKPLLITGSPGGRTIINTVTQVVLNVLEFEMDLRSAVDAPRLHHQWLPDEAKFEGFKQYSETVAALEKMGHKVKPIAKQGDAHSIYIDPKTGAYIGVADKRISGKAAGY